MLRFFPFLLSLIILYSAAGQSSQALQDIFDEISEIQSSRRETKREVEKQERRDREVTRTLMEYQKMMTTLSVRMSALDSMVDAADSSSDLSTDAMPTKPSRRPTLVKEPASAGSSSELSCDSMPTRPARRPTIQKDPPSPPKDSSPKIPFRQPSVNRRAIAQPPLETNDAPPQEKEKRRFTTGDITEKVVALPKRGVRLAKASLSPVRNGVTSLIRSFSKQDVNKTTPVPTQVQSSEF